MCGCDCCKEQDVAVASRMGRVSRNPTTDLPQIRHMVASRMGRVSRNAGVCGLPTSGKGRVPHGARE